MPWFKVGPGFTHSLVRAREKVPPGVFELAENTHSPGCPAQNNLDDTASLRIRRAVDSAIWRRGRVLGAQDLSPMIHSSGYYSE